jgi:hypothetical protein
MTTPAVTIEHNRRARRFLFGCTCGWSGDTASLYRAAAAFEEHLRACDGEPPVSRTAYTPEDYEGRPTTYPKPPAAEDN